MTAGSIAVPQIIPLRVPLPGKPKSEIDTNTLIGIKSDTPDVDIYYTLNGSRPQFLKKPSCGESSTLKYKKPFTLQAGKGTIKALAVSRDGRESGVVTKVFLVEYVQLNTVEVLEDDDQNFLQDYAKELSRQETLEGLGPHTATFSTTLNKESKHAWEETIQKIPELKIDDNGLHKSFNSPRFLNSRLGTLVPGRELTSTSQSHRSQLAASIDASPPKTLSSTQTMRIQRETDFLKCVCCLAPRPSDPFARFCQECGSPVPPVPGCRLPPPEGAQMGLCVECKTMVPLNTPTCIVCEAPITPQLKPEASISLKNKIICRSCGTGNPANVQHCLICETRLSRSLKPHFSGDSTPSLPSQEGKMLACSKCGRVNNTDARFCDWCGAKPGPPMSYLSCSKCGATNHPCARFCGSCGLYLEPPMRVDSRNSALFGSGQSTVLAEATDQHNSATWQPLTIPLPMFTLESNKEDQGTQTVGLFYPSCMVLEKKEMEISCQQAKQQKIIDRRPLLTAISPGKGYWRLQLDHICAHLRSYTQNNTEFRALIGEPQMGKIISATVHEDGYELSLQLNFALAGNKNIPTRKSAKLSENNFLSSVTEGGNGYHGSLTSLASESHSSGADTSKKPIKSRRKRQVTTKEDRLPLNDRQLLKEVGPTGLGRVSEIQQLLDEGADPNCSNNDDRPALTVAVMNQHHEVVPVLVQKGADINQQSGPLKNTALHEAAELGAQGVKCVAVLLGCNASIKKKNDKALTAYDLAVKTGNDQLTLLFAAKMGQGMLDKFTKTKHVSLDVF
ncbi:double zinc ribbon and ankyrin repeat-containing protein 1 isoform X1 [Carcharodon carcharias]|uniref:double zinc ribbon and ankyrin repeat-containing protein 1 isoform X1 n=1 Tax=Carcharodon carcharias TaxID=13397 RepID=UPI001B7F710B|nr:double zinc ribbon and ankyrin repeat-containing protein 1 isoform X1 [Carcharodon carcharias]XP_041033384.1 double zinc ribbon and ankyrin repeat-containing protein 1 isoform X1 [Carcharodon carcharias]XP_041033392.1 double zinc ribbon and ankyrin repeat-containing protein 1 isoform X1 [Carcharodon carcharias]